MTDTTRADIIALQEQVRSLRAQLNTLHDESEARYATRAYVAEYIQQMIGDLLPVEDSYTENTLLAGYIPLYIDRVIKYFNKSTYTTVDKTSILLSYDDHARKANINPYLAVAQMAKETDWLRSWWSQRPRRNPAGLGVTGMTSAKEPSDKYAWFQRDDGVWVQGYSFPSWNIAAAAHIGHLLTYMYKDDTLTEDQKILVATDPRSRFVPDNIRGNVQILKDLDGKWAVPGTGYGKSIAILANALKK